MADLLLKHSIQSKISSNKESFQNKTNIERINNLMTLFILIISVLSFYLSWERNTFLNEPFALKILYGIGSAILGTTYILFYCLRAIIDEDMIKRLNLSGIKVH
jgi:hypothetical protein